jgi:hypothetical protein
MARVYRVCRNLVGGDRGPRGYATALTCDLHSDSQLAKCEVVVYLSVVSAESPLWIPLNRCKQLPTQPA